MKSRAPPGGSFLWPGPAHSRTPHRGPWSGVWAGLRVQTPSSCFFYPQRTEVPETLIRQLSPPGDQLNHLPHWELVCRDTPHTVSQCHPCPGQPGAPMAAFTARGWSWAGQTPRCLEKGTCTLWPSPSPTAAIPAKPPPGCPPRRAWTPANTARAIGVWAFPICRGPSLQPALHEL